MSTATVKKTPAKGKAKTAFSAPIAEVHLVPLDLIDVKTQIRTEFDSESIQELAADIAARGLMQPILLNPVGDRFVVIAGERRLRAIKLNGQSAIPALLTKASSEEALLMQLAENIQREELSLTEECQAVCSLHALLGNLQAVSEKVKKSIPWCSKRYAMKQEGLHWKARRLLEDGVTEDIELLKSYGTLCDLTHYGESEEWYSKIVHKEVGRNEIRAEVKRLKDEVKNKKETEKAEQVSHAKPKSPPPPPEWSFDDAMDEISEALSDVEGEQTAAELINTWTPEQQEMIRSRLNESYGIGQSDLGYHQIKVLVMEGIWNTDYWDIDLIAMISGYAGKPFSLDALQVKIAKDNEIN